MYVRGLLVFLVMAIDIYGQEGAALTVEQEDLKIHVESHLSPLEPALSRGVHFGLMDTTEIKDGLSVSRYLVDSASHEYFAYLISVSYVSPETYRITISGASPSPDRLGLSPRDGWKLIPPPKIPASQTMKTTDRMALTVFVDRHSGQKLIDYIHVEEVFPCHTDAACLARYLGTLRSVVSDKVEMLSKDSAGSSQKSLRPVQQVWEAYQQGACSGLQPDYRQLRCQTLLELDRIKELNAIAVKPFAR